MIRLEAASPISQRRYDFVQRRIVNAQVQKFVRTRYQIDPDTPQPVPAKPRGGFWGALAGLFRGPA